MVVTQSSTVRAVHKSVVTDTSTTHCKLAFSSSLRTLYIFSIPNKCHQLMKAFFVNSWLILTVLVSSYGVCQPGLQIIWWMLPVVCPCWFLLMLEVYVVKHWSIISVICKLNVTYLALYIINVFFFGNIFADIALPGHGCQVSTVLNCCSQKQHVCTYT